jgi:hypothetical protein
MRGTIQQELNNSSCYDCIRGETEKVSLKPRESALVNCFYLWGGAFEPLSLQEGEPVSDALSITLPSHF